MSKALGRLNQAVNYVTATFQSWKNCYQATCWKWSSDNALFFLTHQKALGASSSSAASRCLSHASHASLKTGSNSASYSGRALPRFGGSNFFRLVTPSCFTRPTLGFSSLGAFTCELLLACAKARAAGTKSRQPGPWTNSLRSLRATNTGVPYLPLVAHWAKLRK